MTEFVIYTASWLQIVTIPFLVIMTIADSIKRKVINPSGLIASFGGMLFLMLFLAFETRIRQLYKKRIEDNKSLTISEMIFVMSLTYLPPVATYFYASYIWERFGG